MKATLRSRSGIAAEVVILAVALLGGAGWFGVKQIKQAIVEHKQDVAAQELAKRQAASEAAAKAAAEERGKAEQARAEAEAKREQERREQVNTGRTIQRASAQAALITAQLPTSLERTLLADRFIEIDTASGQLFGVPASTELTTWRKIAADALAGQAEAQAKLADQINEVRRLTTELRLAQEFRQTAETAAKEADKKATTAQNKFDESFSKQKVAENKLIDAMKQGDTLSVLISGLKLILFAIAGFWLLGLLLKIFAISLPADGPLARLAHLLANFFHSIMAPMAVAAETHAKRDTEQLVESTANFITDLRGAMPELDGKVTNLLDVSLSPFHQKKVAAKHLAIRRQRATAQIN